MKTYILIFLSLLAFNVKAQKKLNVSVESGINVTFIKISDNNQMFNDYYSDYESDGDTYDNSRPGFRGFIGVGVRHNFTKASSLKLFTQLEQRGSKNTHTLAGGAQGYTVNNSYVNLGLMYYYSLPKVLEIGIGISNHFLIASRSIIKNQVLSIDDSELDGSYGSYSNYNFKKYLISVPIQLGLKLGKNERVTLVETLDIPIMNRLNNLSTKYKQYEFTLQTGVNVKIGKL